MAQQIVELLVNGDRLQAAVDPWTTLGQALREKLGFASVAKGCEQGRCGACTVLVDGRAVSSCLMLALEAHLRDVTTIEGLTGPGGKPHPVQEAFAAHGVGGCPNCTPGMVLSAVGLLNQNPDPGDDDIRAGLAGSLCRCTGFNQVRAAVRAAGKVLREGGNA